MEVQRLLKLPSEASQDWLGVLGGSCPLPLLLGQSRGRGERSTNRAPGRMKMGNGEFKANLCYVERLSQKTRL